MHPRKLYRERSETVWQGLHKGKIFKIICGTYDMNFFGNFYLEKSNTGVSLFLKRSIEKSANFMVFYLHNIIIRKAKVLTSNKS